MYQMHKMDSFDIVCEDLYWSFSGRQAFNFDDEDANSSMFVNSVWDSKNEDSSFESNEQEVFNITIKDVITDNALSIVLQEQALDECIISKGLDSDKEIKLLRRQIQSTLYNPDTDATAFKLLQGKYPPLEIFRSFEEKQMLLDSILQQHGGGDAMIGVLLYLKRTLNRVNFFQVLKERSKALEHYISYLLSCCKSEKLPLDVLKQFGRSQECFLVLFCAALKNRDVTMKKCQLKNLIDDKNNEYSNNVNQCLKQIAQNALKLLDFIGKEQKFLDNMVDDSSTAIEVLYCCSHKYTNWKDDSLTISTSPFRISFEQKISLAQFEWTALNERAKSQAYADLERIFEHLPTWHPIKNKQFHINFSLETAVMRLHDLTAPISVIYLFLSKMSDSTEKLELSLRVKCYKASIDALFTLRNSNELKLLRDKLPDRSEEKFYCDKALKNLQSKRWSTDNLKIKL